MANYVDDNELFTLQQVYDAVSDHDAPSDDLQSCFDNAIQAYFNPDYNNDTYAPALSMLRFRDYKPNIAVPFYYDSIHVYDVQYIEPPYSMSYIVPIGNASATFANNYVGSAWKTLVITSIVNSVDNLFTITNNGNPISTPLSLDVEGISAGSDTPIAWVFSDPTGKTDLADQVLTISYYIIDINNLVGATKDYQFRVTD